MSEQQSDPFATQGPDPFATATSSPAEEIEATEPDREQIPVVNREGQPVAQQESTPPSSTPADPAVTPADAPQENDQPATAPQEPQEAPQTPEEASQQGEAPDEPQDAPDGPQEGEATVAEANGRAVGPRGGKGELRYYKIAYQTGPTSWEFHRLDSVPEGIDVETVDGERWIRARNNEHALRLGFQVVGSPQEGVTVWPVPKGAYKPKPVRPAPPRPERTRLVIG